MIDSDFASHLKSIVGPKGWLDGSDTARFTEDPRGRVAGKAGLVLRPASVDAVSAILKLCNAARVGIIPFGGGTGGANGHLDPEGRNLVLSLERLTAIRDASAKDNSLTVEAGVTLSEVQEAAQGVGRLFGLSLASEGSCTIGGNLASNAGGVQTLRYGNARDLCLGLEVVTAEGDILNGLSPLRKDNTGYDLRHLFIGSEGTLGVITAATLKLSAIPQSKSTMICAVPTPDAGLDLLNAIRDHLGDAVSAFELMSELGMALAIKHFPDLPRPFKTPNAWYVVTDICGPDGTQARLDDILEKSLEAGLITDAVLASSLDQAQRLWALRERAFEYNKLEQALYSSDTSVPLGKIGAFVRTVCAELERLDPTLRANCYGHIGDGNIHVNVFGPQDTPGTCRLGARAEAAPAIARVINETTVTHGGSISAEHGIGRSKIDDLRRYGDPVKLALMRRIKQAFDPNNIMNPGAVL